MERLGSSKMMDKMNKIAFLLIWAFFGCQKSDVSNSSSTSLSNPVTPVKTYSGTGSMTQGLATITVNSLYACAGGRVTAVGNITSTDAKTWIVPAENSFSSGNKLPDLFNECNSKSPSSIAQVDTAKVPTTIIDSDGEIITGFIYGDNYFELYVNGKLVGVDAVPFTPFNSSFVKFKAKRPIKYAIKLVDWEENLGLGTELNGGDANHPGDGGFIAKFSDGTVTNGSWKAQTFYIAPLASVDCVTETGTARNSSGCPLTSSAGLKSYALHWAIPSNWFATDFDFATWPVANLYTETAVGPKNAFTNFSPQFSGASFIWSSNLILDNLVLLRFTGK